MSFWTIEEKRSLLQALHQYDANEIGALKKALPNKTETEIEQVCQEYSMQALKKQADNSKEASIKRWLQILKKLRSSQKGQINDIIPRVLKYIALFEKRYPSEKVDLVSCYLALHHMSTGLAAKELKGTTDYFMYDCLTKLATSLKRDGVKASRNHLATVNNIKDLHTHRNSSNSKLESSVTLNPLGIPDNLLHLSGSEILNFNQSLK